MKFCIAGKNNIAVEILLYLLERVIEKEIYIIPNKTDDGNDFWQKSLLKKAHALKLNVVTLEEVYDIENLIFLSLEFDRIVNPLKFRSKELFNIHFSLLPKYKGMFTSIMPILNNEKLTGATFHRIDKGIDTGEIIKQIEFPIDIMDNSRDVYCKYIKHGIELVKQCVDKILNHEVLNSYRQDSLESTYFSRKSINFSNIQIDINQTAINIHNQIRAFNFREYQVPKVFNMPIISSKILNNSSSKKAGEIIFEDDISFVISTVDNDIVLYKDKVDDLFMACKDGSLELINRLVQIPKIINIQNDKGWTPLIVAIYNNHKSITKTLLQHGADLNTTNFKGTTALMYAKSSYMKYQDEYLLKLILSLGVDIYQKDYENKNVLEYCVENNELSALSIIKESIR